MTDEPKEIIRQLDTIRGIIRQSPNPKGIAFADLLRECEKAHLDAIALHRGLNLLIEGRELYCPRIGTFALVDATGRVDRRVKV